MENSKKENAFMNSRFVKVVGPQKVVILLVLIALCIFFYIMSPSFRQYSTVLSILDYTYYITFMAIGVTFCLITGGVDLSLGTGMICYGLIGGFFINQLHCPVGVAILVTLVVAVLFGVFNGVLVGVFELPPFIATLGTMMITRGYGSLATGGLSETWPAKGTPDGWFRSIFKIQVGTVKVPIGILWLVLLIVIMSIVLNHTKIGRYIIAIGSNKEATRLSGVNVVKYTMAAYIISGICTGFATIAYAATFQALAPGTGAGMELDAIGGAIIGGTAMTGGSGTITGTIIGVFIMSVLKTGLPYIGLQANWQQVIIGMVLIFAVLLDVMKNRKIA